MNSLNTTTLPNSTVQGHNDVTDKGIFYQWSPSVIVWLCLGLLGLSLNIAETVALRCKVQRSTAFSLILVSLSVADLLACATYVLYAITFLSTYSSGVMVHPVFEAVRIVSQKLIFCFLVVSCLHVVMIAVQRLCAARFPFSFANLFSTKRCLVSTAVAWTIAISYAVLNAYYDVIKAVSCYLVFVVGAMLISVYCVVICQTAAKSSAFRSNLDDGRKQSKRVLLHSIFVATVFIACHFPYAISFLLFASNRQLLRYTYGLFQLRPIIDPFLYFFVHRKNNRVSRVVSCK